jgi:hypothetical protein
MVDYASRIASLKSEQTKLAQRQTELATQRREAIGRLAERLGVLSLRQAQTATPWHGGCAASERR